MRHRILLGSIAALTVLFATVSLAWACVPTGGLSLNPSSGPAGTRVTATLVGMAPGVPVELRWNAVSGPMLASGTSGTGAPTTMSFTVPDAPPGVYTVLALGAGEHADHGQAGSAFVIPNAGGTPPPSGTTPPPSGTTPPPVGTTPPPASNAIVSPVSAVLPRSTAQPVVNNRARRARAIRSCKRKYKAKRSTSSANRRKLARKRAACIRKARKKYR